MFLNLNYEINTQNYSVSEPVRELVVTEACQQQLPTVP